MFEGWENFYLIVGPSAGALIGLMFVVVMAVPVGCVWLRPNEA